MERKGEGRALATAGASGWLRPSASPPRAAGGSLPWGPQICSSHAPNPVWLQDGSLSLSLCKDSGMKISVYIEAHIFFLFDHCPLAVPSPRHAGKYSRGIITSVEGTTVSLIGKGMCNSSLDPSAATGPSSPSLPADGTVTATQPPASPQVLHTCSDMERLHIWTS